jgi:cytochrome c553
MKKYGFSAIIFILSVWNANAASVNFDTQIQPIFTANCVRCHGGSGGLFLTSGASYNNLVGVISQNYAPAVRVASGDLTNSVMYNKINNTGVYGGVMPQDAGRMSQANIDLIATWIAQLACTSCLTVGNDIRIPITCAEYNGKKYMFDLLFSSNPADPIGLYWKMDLNTFKEK